MLGFVLIKVNSTKLKKLLGGIALLTAVGVEWLIGAMSMVVLEYVNLWMATQGQRDRCYSKFN